MHYAYLGFEAKAKEMDGSTDKVHTNARHVQLPCEPVMQDQAGHLTSTAESQMKY